MTTSPSLSLSLSLSLTTTIIILIITLGLPLVMHPTPCRASRILHPAPADTTEFIRTSCSTTLYPALCVTSLSSYSSAIQSSPKQLALTALSVALTAARSTSAALKAMSSSAGTGGGMSPRVAAAMSDCMDTVAGDSIDELKQSVEVMGHINVGKEFAFQLNSVQTWVSAAITDDNTCTDGFGGRAMDGKVKSEVRRHVVNVAQLTSNALAFINRLAYN